MIDAAFEQRKSPRLLAMWIGLALLLLTLSVGDVPNYASSPLCVMEIWTTKSEYRTDEQVQLNMWIKVNTNPELPEITSARLELELRSPFGTFITLRTQENIALGKGAEWQQALLTLPVNSEPFRNLGDYEAHALLLSPDDQVLCEAYTAFSIKSVFGREATTRTLIVTSRRTDFTEPFVSRLSVWLEASYRTRVQVIYQEGILQSYQSGVYENFDVIIYYGTDFDQSPPPSFLTDITQGEAIATKKVVWIGYHLDKLGATLADYGLRYGEFTSDNDPSPLRYVDTGRDFTLLNHDRVTVGVEDERLAQVRATVDVEPIITSSRHIANPTGDPSFYFVGFHPTAFLTPFGAHLVFLDLMTEVYGLRRGKIALVRLEDIDATDDPAGLLSLTRFLRDERVPFTLALIPIYRDGQREIRLSRDREFRMMVKNALLDGGELVLHGATHQYDGVTGEDYEFWDETSDTPVGRKAYAEERVAAALMEIEFSGLSPYLVGWETPHYAAGEEHYEVFERFFKLLYEDPRWTYDLKLTPYPVTTEHTVYVPTNLGFVRGESMSADVEQILRRAQLLSGLQYGALGSFYYHPQLGLEGLRSLIHGLKAQGWTFAPVSSLARPGA